MADTEISEQVQQRTDQNRSPDIVVGIAGPVPAADLRTRAAAVLAEIASAAESIRFAFALPASATETVEAAESQNGQPSPQLITYPAPGNDSDFWPSVSANQRAVVGLAASLNARACIVLGSDLAGLHSQVIQLFTYAVLERQCALVMPIYPAGKYEGLLNSGILSPLSSALYGKRIRHPLPFDFAASGAMCTHLAQAETAGAGNSLLWPVTVAATQIAQASVGQVHIDVRHQVAAAGLELSAVLGQLAGSLFEEMQACAPHWQRIRGSQPGPVWGNAAIQQTEDETIDVQPMLDSFLLGSKNLDEVWRLLLPPNSMLELRRLTRLPAEQFRMPDELWAGIVYDFALAWRLRTISRVHLLGALTPLYLGWVASWVREVAALPPAGVEQRLEQFNRAWEEKKPYLLSRWRWPDRFNP
jgi:glucosylglycerate synthase